MASQIGRRSRQIDARRLPGASINGCKLSPKLGIEGSSKRVLGRAMVAGHARNGGQQRNVHRRVVVRIVFGVLGLPADEIDDAHAPIETAHFIATFEVRASGIDAALPGSVLYREGAKPFRL